MAETVEVAGEAPLVTTESATVGPSSTNQRIVRVAAQLDATLSSSSRGNDRPNVVPSVDVTSGPRTPNEWFNIQAFALQPQLGANSVPIPGAPNPRFGTITSTKAGIDMRELQFSLKLIFSGNMGLPGLAHRLLPDLFEAAVKDLIRFIVIRRHSIEGSVKTHRIVTKERAHFRKPFGWVRLTHVQQEWMGRYQLDHSTHKRVDWKASLSGAYRTP